MDSDQHTKSGQCNGDGQLRGFIVQCLVMPVHAGGNHAVA